MTTLMTQIKNAVHADTYGKRKDGCIVLRRGFFYKMGGSSESFAASVTEQMKAAGIDAHVVDSGEVWKAFRGGASTASSSHWWVAISPTRVIG